MKKVENMISSKDLSYISDIFNWNITTSKKIEHYQKICKDDEICKELKKINKIHLKNCNNLISILESSECND